MLINTYTDKYDEIGVKVLRNEQGLWFHSDEANVHAPIQNHVTMAFENSHFPKISLDHSL